MVTLATTQRLVVRSSQQHRHAVFPFLPQHHHHYHQQGLASPSSQQQPCPTNMTATTSSNASQKVLLLEGDGFYVSPEGFSRTVYKLARNQSSMLRNRTPGFAIEEICSLQDSSKSFLLYKTNHPLSESSSSLPAYTTTTPLTNSYKLMSSIHIDEISGGVAAAGTTGATTWESTIAMALYFSTDPSRLRGHVVELGCGLGLGGALLFKFLFPQTNPNQPEVQSITLTDGSQAVLQQCRSNLARQLNDQNEASAAPSPSLRISHLDWNDFVGDPQLDSSDKSHTKHHDQYDTVIACDCAYRSADVPGLSHTAVELLKQSPLSTIHLFSPYNRAVVHEMAQYLRDEMHMNVDFDWIDLQRCRLKPGEHHSRDQASWQHCDTRDCDLASQSTSTFVHVEVSRRAESFGWDPKGLESID